MGYAIFGTDANCHNLDACPVTYCDATFVTTPFPWTQFLNVMGDYGGRPQCFLNILMSGKTLADYIAVFRGVQVIIFINVVKKSCRLYTYR